MSSGHKPHVHEGKNVGLVCADCAPKPGKFVGTALTAFLGKFVKLGFPAVNPRTGKDTKEHMWIHVKSYSGKELRGVLMNHPIFATEAQYGDEIAFTVDEIEDIETP